MGKQIKKEFSKEALDWVKAFEEERNKKLAEVNRDLNTKKDCSICGEEIKGYGLDLEYFKYFRKEDVDFKEVIDSLSKKDGCICSSCYLKEFKIDKLYHVSTNLDIIDGFEFRIPDNRFDGEDTYIGRVCLSDSVSGAISGFPYVQQVIYPVEYKDIYLRVYEFDVKDLPINQVIPPEYLYQKNLVRDSISTREFWVAEKLGEDEWIDASRSYLIKVDDVITEKIYDISYKDKLLSIKNSQDDFKDLIRGEVLKVNVSYEVVKKSSICIEKI